MKNNNQKIKSIFQISDKKSYLTAEEENKDRFLPQKKKIRNQNRYLLSNQKS